MQLSKSSRILILLAVDTVFFLLELTAGYAVHSLALVADAFHMLNDVLSLCVGLWAVKVANQKDHSKMYTYGWQRAETLGALINGVFLVALCLSIFLEAIQRFVEPQEVSHPKFVLIIGCWGLASNIFGLFLFHDHGHGHSHGHSHGGEVGAAEEGHSHSHEADLERQAVADERGNIADVLPQTRVAKITSPTKTAKSGPTQATEYGGTTVQRAGSGRRSSKSGRRRSRGYSLGPDEIYVHPTSFRNSIIESSHLEHSSESESDPEAAVAEEEATEQSPLLKTAKSAAGTVPTPKKKDKHSEHNHKKPKEAGGHGGHGHSHGDLNMRGVFLHVVGDALGNVGVIASALIIWLTDYSWRFYADPLISLIITVIILCSAIPLCKAASRILLQAVPAGLSIDDIKDDINSLPGVVSCHHVHVWQLSDSKLIASLHVQVDFDFEGSGAAQYMELAREIRECLHEYGIHSSTIQPEFCLDANHDHTGATDESEAGDDAASGSRGSSRSRGAKGYDGASHPDACLLECGDACGDSKQCCHPAAKGCGAAGNSGSR